MAPGGRSKFGAPLFDRELFRKQIYCIKESACDIVGTFQRRHSDLVPGELCFPCPSTVQRGPQQLQKRTYLVFKEAPNTN